MSLKTVSDLQMAEAFVELEHRFGPLTRLDGGMQGRVYAAPNEKILKVYRKSKGEHLREANNMRAAGMVEWVHGTLEIGAVEVLIMRRFYGAPVTAASLPSALPALRQQLQRLHQQSYSQGHSANAAASAPQVSLQAVQARLQKFRKALAAYQLADLFEAIEKPLERGQLVQQAAFCHLDLWHDNILVSHSQNDVLVIDWSKAAWDDPLRDLALLKTGTLDLLPANESLQSAVYFLPDANPATLLRFGAYLALTTLHDLYWFLMNEPYHFDVQYEKKARRTRHSLIGLKWLAK